MGNLQTHNWQSDYQIQQSPLPIKKAINKQSQQRYQFISLFPCTQDQRQDLQNRIKLRTSKSSPYLVPLSNYWVKDQFASCGGKPQFDIFFKQTTPLEQYLTYRRVKKQSFSTQEIQYIIWQVANGLKDIKEMKEQYGCVNFNNIVVDGEVKLKDPFVVREEQSWLRRFKKIQGFPSPQKLYTLFDSLSSFEVHANDLFSLGIVSLQLIYLHENLAQLYKNTNSQYLNCTIDMNQLRNYVVNVRDQSLRNAISILTHEQPTKRLAIYQYIAQRKGNKDNLKILQENPYEIIQSEKVIVPNTEMQATKAQASQPLQKIQENTLLVTNGIRKVDSVTVPQEQKPIPFGTKTYESFIFQKPQVSFNSAPFQPVTNQMWKPTKMFQSSFRKVSEGSDNFTPINKINDIHINSFKSTKFNFPQIPKITYPSSINYQSMGKSDFKMQRVLPKYIDNTYRTSFIPNAETQHVPNTQLVIDKQTQSIPLTQVQPEQVVSRKVDEQGHNLNIVLNEKEEKKDNQQKIQKAKEQPNTKEQTPIQSLIILQSLPNHHQQRKQPQNNSSYPTQKQTVQQNVLTSMTSPQKQALPQIITPINQQQGFVVEQYQIGTRYQGYMKNGMRNGEGQFIYKQGSKYKGQWKDNQMQGYGTLYYPSGVIAYQGQWKNDQFHGYGTVYNDSPHKIKTNFDFTNFNSLENQWNRYQGQLKNDAKQGQGTLYLTNGEFYTGSFANDFVDGEGQFKKINGTIVRGVWSEGLLKRIIYQ